MKDNCAEKKISGGTRGQKRIGMERKKRASDGNGGQLAKNGH